MERDGASRINGSGCRKGSEKNIQTDARVLTKGFCVAGDAEGEDETDGGRCRGGDV
jgi:hypothetical protein